jgi:hypothetical protein
MYKPLCWLAIAGFCAMGQTPQILARFDRSLRDVMVSSGGVDDSLSRNFVDNILALALPERQPSRQLVARFTDALRGVAAGRPLSSAQAAVFSQCILGLMRGQGASNFGLASQLRTALTALGAADQKASRIVRQFVALGEAVRGPDDSPVYDLEKLEK